MLGGEPEAIGSTSEGWPLRHGALLARSRPNGPADPIDSQGPLFATSPDCNGSKAARQYARVERPYPALSDIDVSATRLTEG